MEENRPQRILIAEDNSTLAESMAQLLARRGYRVETAGDGVRALGRIAAEPPDLLLLDLRLPKLHGVELLKKLRQSGKTRALPVVIVSGVYRGEKYRQAVAKLGVSHYLEKPFRAEALLKAVSRSLQSTPASGPLPQLLVRYFRQRFSGRLQLSCDGRQFFLDLIRGRPVGLSPGVTHADFGAWLQHRGRISAEEYAWYRHAGQGCHTSLVELGCLEYPELLQEKLTWLSSELVAGFALPPLSCRTDPFRIPDNLQVVAVNLPRLLYEGYHHHPPAEDPFVTRLDRYAGLTDAYFRYINFLRLNEEEKRLLARLTGDRRLRECLAGLDIGRALLRVMNDLEMITFADSPLPAATAGDRPLRELFNQPDDEIEPPADDRLESFGDILDDDAVGELETPASEGEQPAGDNYLAEEVRRTHAELKGKNYYEIFGMRSGEFSFDLLRERYFALTRKFGPETLMQLGGEDATLAEEILAQVSTAYNTLSDVVKKENYDQMLGSDRIGLGEEGDDRFQAQVQFQSGKTFLEMEEWEEAEKALQDACNIDPDNGVYLANLAWAIYRNPQNRQSRAMRDKARQLLARAMVLEKSGEAFAYKGWMHLDAGQESLAEAEFTKALKRDPRQLLARKGLRAIREKREQEKKGLFRRMFG
ncbi:response regulator [Geothermobacter ehrlichii]|uniref:response regulator n=1 Tax=Geothermobacter ehrlichii TaxID=213224 RepID=UPI0011E68E25|nr:response regulator [Geothermobacter ehrlichii]